MNSRSWFGADFIARSDADAVAVLPKHRCCFRMHSLFSKMGAGSRFGAHLEAWSGVDAVAVLPSHAAKLLPLKWQPQRPKVA